ncbi:MAG TPA: hypothetical protein VGL56_00805 [Fimbriimonadaceae bacterium]|jgi:hypothetical protein
MNSNAYKPLYLAKVIEGIWTVSAAALGENHLLSQAFETALRSNDPDLMERALKLLGGSSDVVKQRILTGATNPV